MTWIWDQENRQLLSIQCRQCQDPHFQSISKEFEQVGCCRYEPVFTLFEIWKMLKKDQESFFKKEIYFNPRNRVFAYEIIAGAIIHPLFYERGEDGCIPAERYNQLMSNPHTKYQGIDLRLKYGICSFFVKGEGCGLEPSFKTSICRMFICDSIEDTLNKKELKKLHDMQRMVREEADCFQRAHVQALKQKGINLIEHLDQVVDYLKGIE
jgi:hypothetical protein